MKVAVWKDKGNNIHFSLPNGYDKDFTIFSNPSGMKFLKYVELPDYAERGDYLKGGVPVQGVEKGRASEDDEPKDVSGTSFFESLAMSIGSDEELTDAVYKGTLFHKDRYHKYYRYQGKIFVTDNQFKERVDQVAAVDNLLDELDRENGDAPHRAVDRLTRIKVLCRFKNEKEPVEKNDHEVDWLKYSMMPKPSLGLKPRKLVDEERLAEIDEACKRYIAEGKTPPAEWLIEWNEIKVRIDSSKDVLGRPLVTKEAQRAEEHVDFSAARKLVTYQFPICALDIKPPTYKVKE